MTKAWVLKEINSIKKAILDFIARVDSHGTNMHAESEEAISVDEDMLIDLAYQQTLNKYDV